MNDDEAILNSGVLLEYPTICLIHCVSVWVVLYKKTGIENMQWQGILKVLRNLFRLEEGYGGLK